MYFTQWRLCGDLLLWLPLLLKLQLPLFFRFYILLLYIWIGFRFKATGEKQTNNNKKTTSKSKERQTDRQRDREKKIDMDGHNYAITRFYRSDFGWDGYCCCCCWCCVNGELEQNRSFNFTWNHFIIHTHKLTHTNIFRWWLFSTPLRSSSFAKFKPGQCFQTCFLMCISTYVPVWQCLSMFLFAFKFFKILIFFGSIPFAIHFLRFWLFFFRNY